MMIKFSIKKTRTRSTQGENKHDFDVVAENNIYWQKQQQ